MTRTWPKGRDPITGEYPGGLFDEADYLDAQEAAEAEREADEESRWEARRDEQC